MKPIRPKFINKDATSLLLAIFTIFALTGTSMGQSFEQPVSNVIDSDQKTITVTEDIRYREGDSDAWKLDLAMPANFGSELRPELEGGHGVAYNEQLDVTEPALEKFFAKHLKPGQQ